MAKTSAAPKNFYTAAQATKRLGIPKTTFFHYVRTGKIKKVVPPGQVEGYYPKIDIDKMAKERELFILEYAAEPSNFNRASEEDIRGIYDLCVSLFGITGTPTYELMLSWQRKNPLTYYVVKQEDIITGYIGFLYLNEGTTRFIMSESVPGVPSPASTEVLPFTPGAPIEGLFIGLAVRPGLSLQHARSHGRHLMTGGIEVLENFVRQGMPVRKLYATSRTPDGIKLCNKLGFTETMYPGDPIIRYELDVEKSDSPLLEDYRQILARANNHKAQHDSRTDSRTGEFPLTTTDASEQNKPKRASPTRSKQAPTGQKSSVI
jgi:hypothetical protein